MSVGRYLERQGAQFERGGLKEAHGGSAVGTRGTSAPRDAEQVWSKLGSDCSLPGETGQVKRGTATAHIMAHHRYSHLTSPTQDTHMTGALWYYYRHASRVGRATCRATHAGPATPPLPTTRESGTPPCCLLCPTCPTFRAPRDGTRLDTGVRGTRHLPHTCPPPASACALRATAHGSLSTAVRGTGRPGGPRRRGRHAGARGSRGSCAPSGCTGSTWLLCRPP